MRKVREEEFKRLFLAEQNENLKKIIEALLKYRLKYDRHYLDELKQFFHKLNGTGGTLHFQRLSEIGKEYEDFINSLTNPLDISHKLFSTLMEGVAKVREELVYLNNERFKFTADENEHENKDTMFLDEYLVNIDNGRIMLVDDDKSLLSMLEISLTDEGYKVFTISNPKDAIPLLGEKRMDLIVLDVVMPEIDGFELFQRIRAEKIDTPVMFLTAEGTTDEKLKGFQIGADDYIVKPFDLMELRARIRRTLSSFRAKNTDLFIDKTTGAYTKALLNENFKVARWRLYERNESTALAIIDIDSFKSFNEKHGYADGDKLLRMFYTDLKNNLRATDQIYRIGGDEFAVLFTDTSTEKAFKVIDSVRKNMNLKWNPSSETITFCAGITCINGERENVLDVLSYAAEALESAKQGKQGKIVLSKKKDSKSEQQSEICGKVLIVDDSDNIIYLVKQRLKALNYEVYFANTGEAGLLKCRIFKPDLLIIEAMIPGMDGFEVCKAVRTDPALKHTKIIVVASKSSKELITKAKEFGIDSFLLKPFSLDEMENRVQKIIE